LLPQADAGPLQEQRVQCGARLKYIVHYAQQAAAEDQCFGEAALSAPFCSRYL